MLRTLGKAAQRAARTELRPALLLATGSATAAGDVVVAAGLDGAFVKGRSAAALFSAFPRSTFHTSAPSFAAQPQEVSEEDVPSGVRGIDTNVVPMNPEKKREGGYLMAYPTYSKEYLESIKPKHKPPEKLYQKTALWAVTAMRWGFDTMTGYPKNMDEKRWLQRMVFLETVAGVPGMVGGMLRHLRSLRTMSRDHGWIHTLLEEAENERMHLLTFLELKKPGPLFRGFVLLTQGVFFNLYTLFYILSPKHCHAFVGYLEEEAVRTYTHAVKDIDSGALKAWQTKKPPQIGVTYWGLGENATMRDLILAIRADEYGHSHVNHTFSVLKPEEDNPFEKGVHQVP